MWCVYGDRIILVTLKLLSVSMASSLVCDLVSFCSLLDTDTSLFS